MEMSKRPMNAKQAWEASVLSGSDEGETELSPTGQLIVDLQREVRSLEVRTKTLDGMMKPLQKNMATLQEAFDKFRGRYLEIEEQTKALEANKKELIRRRLEAEKKTEEHSSEFLGMSNPFNVGPIDFNFQRAFYGIMEILETHSQDEELLEDIQDMIQAFSVVDNTETEGPLNFSPQKRRSMGGSYSNLGGSNSKLGGSYSNLGGSYSNLGGSPSKLSLSSKTPRSGGSGGRSRRRILQGSLTAMGSPSLAASSPSDTWDG